MMLKIRGISNAENLLTGVNRFGHCLTFSSLVARSLGNPCEASGWAFIILLNLFVVNNYVLHLSVNSDHH